MCDCSNSHENNLIEDNGFTYCAGCGQELNQILANEHAWKKDREIFSATSRLGSSINPLFRESSMCTMIIPRKYTNNKECRSAAYSIIKHHSWTSGSTPYHERAKYLIFKQIEKVCHELAINKEIQNRAKLIFSKSNDICSTRADGRIGAITASIIIAAKQSGVPRSPKELANIFNTVPSVITKGTKQMYTILHGHEIITDYEQQYNISSAVDFIDRFCCKLKIKEEITNIIKKVAASSEKNQITANNTPPAIAGGTILIVKEFNTYPKKINKNMKLKIAKVSGVSLVTIIKVRKKIFAYRSYCFDAEDLSILKYDLKKK
jgi:transcription initiation factor TFIIB